MLLHFSIFSLIVVTILNSRKKSMRENIIIRILFCVSLMMQPIITTYWYYLNKSPGKIQTFLILSLFEAIQISKREKNVKIRNKK